MTSADGTHIVQLHPDRVALSRLPPYLGWDLFIDEFQRVLSSASAIRKGRQLSRIGVRFINRIDVPLDDDGMFDHSAYITLGLVPLPIEHGPLAVMSFSTATVLEGGRFGLALNCGKGVSPLVGHGSVTVDIEVFNQVNLPKTQQAIWGQINEIRAWKNRVFEGALTERARKLFE
jgi:uncharacterized protein (TIGR04255 family)